MELQKTYTLQYEDEQLLIHLLDNQDILGLQTFMSQRHHIEKELEIDLSLKVMITISLITLLNRYAIKKGYPVGYVLFNEEDQINRMLGYISVEELQEYDYKLMNIFIDDLSIPKEFQNATIYGILNYIYRNYMEPITVSQIAEALGHTVGYVSHLFKEHMNVNLKDYINQVKVKRASQILAESPEDIAIITMYLGFNSQSYFTKVFKKYMGITPTEHRLKNTRKRHNE